MSVGNYQRKIKLGRPKHRWVNIEVVVIRSRTDSRGVGVIFAVEAMDLAQIQSGQFGSEAHSASYVAGKRSNFT
jgi:hypothetical protein